MKFVEITYRYDAASNLERPRPADPDAALRRLDDGSRAFASLLANLGSECGTAQRVIQVDAGDLGLPAEPGSAPAQRPYAAVLGCADARVPVELIFNEGPNDLFVVRVAGNSLGYDVLGSLKYAVDHLGDSIKLVVILGHSGCGALTAAVDVFLEPAGYLTLASNHILRDLLDRLLIVVHASAKKMAATWGEEVTRRPAYRKALIEMSIVLNAAFAAHTVQREIGKGSEHGMRAVYGVYLLASHDIWAPRAGSREHTGLAEPPRDEQAFAEFADAVVRSDRIASLLDHGG